jgi:hypothetical protein
MTPSPFRSKSVRVTVVLATVALIILLFTHPAKPAWPVPTCVPGRTAAAHC